MKREQFKNRFQTELRDHDAMTYINPLEVMENYYFGRHDIKNYRERAVDRCIDEKVDFSSTANNIYDMSKRFITIKCPVCKSNIVGQGGGGTNNNNHINFRCDCKFEATLTLPDNGIEFKFKENK